MLSPSQIAPKTSFTEDDALFAEEEHVLMKPESAPESGASTGDDSREIEDEAASLSYACEPFNQWTDQSVAQTFLVLTLVTTLFLDTNFIPILSVFQPGCFLMFCIACMKDSPQSSGMRRLLLFGWISMSFVRAIAAVDYFYYEVPFYVAYFTTLLVLFIMFHILFLLIAWLQVRFWRLASNPPCWPQCYSLFLARNPDLLGLVFPFLLTALFQLLFRISPIGGAGNPAMGLARVPGLRQLASVFGEISLVFWIGWLSSVWVGMLIKRTSRKHTTVFVVTTVVIFIAGWIRETIGMGLYNQSISKWPLSKAGMSPLIVSCLTRSPNSLETMVNRTNERLAAGDDLVMWSESAINGTVDPSLFTWNDANPGAMVLATFLAEIPNTDSKLNSVEASQDGFVLQRYNKNRPVPVVESEVKAGSNPPKEFPATFTPRTTTGDQARIGKKLNVAMSICFDFDFPDLIRHARNADLVLGPSWYWASIGDNFWNHNRFRAIENGFTLIKCSEQGITGAVDAYGRTLSAIPTMEDQVHIMEVPVQQGINTAYSSFGFIFGWVCIGVSLVQVLALVIDIVISRWNRNR